MFPYHSNITQIHFTKPRPSKHCPSPAPSHAFRSQADPGKSSNSRTSQESKWKSQSTPHRLKQNPDQKQQGTHSVGARGQGAGYLPPAVMEQAKVQLLSRPRCPAVPLHEGSRGCWERFALKVCTLLTAHFPNSPPGSSLKGNLM